MHQGEQPWLGMHYDGKFYKWLAMPFGLSTAPREWQRLMRPLVIAMRDKGFLCWVYLDDFLILAPTRELAAEGAAQLVSLLEDLGLTVNFRKSQLTPVQKNCVPGVPNQPTRRYDTDTGREATGGVHRH